MRLPCHAELSLLTPRPAWCYDLYNLEGELIRGLCITRVGVLLGELRALKEKARLSMPAF